MSIVHKVEDKVPNEGDVVFCDNGKHSDDIAVFKEGSFYAGGDFPVKRYKMSYVSKWFDMDLYHYNKRGHGSYGVSFEEADNMQDRKGAIE